MIYDPEMGAIWGISADSLAKLHNQRTCEPKGVGRGVSKRSTCAA
jgi:hypothetical protein